MGPVDASHHLRDAELLLKPARNGARLLRRGRFDELVDHRGDHPLAEGVHKLFHGGLVHAELVRNDFVFGAARQLVQNNSDPHLQRNRRSNRHVLGAQHLLHQRAQLVEGAARHPEMLPPLHVRELLQNHAVPPVFAPDPHPALAGHPGQQGGPELEQRGEGAVGALLHHEAVPPARAQNQNQQRQRVPQLQADQRVQHVRDVQNRKPVQLVARHRPASRELRLFWFVTSQTGKKQQTKSFSLIIFFINFFYQIFFINYFFLLFFLSNTKNVNTRIIKINIMLIEPIFFYYYYY